jgi:methionyl aminopeptidase
MRPLEEGDIVNLDVSVYGDGFHIDLNATYPVGNIDSESKRLIDAAEGALNAAIAICKPGAMYRDIGNTIEASVKPTGFSIVRTYCGHGIGRLFHCEPNVPHYARNKAVGVMRPGHVFTIEPMINAGAYQDRLWPDDWTAVTADGKRSAQFEHTLLITETGVEVLTAAFK